jgi:hypothetical protein
LTGWYSTPEPEIVWIKNIEQINEKYPLNSYYKKSVFAKYEVVDITHDNKIVAVKASPKTAEERKAKQLAYKKHAKCEVIVRENDIQSKLNLDLSNVFGTEASYEMVSQVERKQRKLWDSGNNWRPTIRDLIIVDRNINVELKVVGVEVDKNIITKTEKEMRLTVLKVEDRKGNHTTITLFDNHICDKFADPQNPNAFVKLTNAEVNMRKRNYSDSQSEAIPEGLKIPSWSKIEIIDSFSELPVEQIPTSIEEPEEDAEVRCEQVHCRGQGKDQQFFCVKCDMELCSICIFEHKKDTSISGLECDNEICYGSRKQNTLEVAQN